MDSLIRERNGVEEIWYSEKYLKEQMENAFQSGLSRGCQINYVVMVNPNDKIVDPKIVSVFKNYIREQLKKSVDAGEVWRISK